MADEKKPPPTDEKTYMQRLDICRACPKRQGRLLVMSRCGVCGCPVASKAVLPNWHCPIGKW